MLLNLKFLRHLAGFCSLRIQVLALAVFMSTAAQADEGLRLSGFGTMGYADDDRSDLAPVRDITQKAKNGASTGASWRLDSRLGMQFEYGINNSFDIVGQMVVRDQYKSDVNSSTELLYLSYRPQTRLDVRLGRINFDAFLMSDHRNVGYAYTWVRPPSEFYSWIPIFSLNGIDVAYNIQSENARWRIKLQAGNSAASLPIGDGYKFLAQNMRGISVTRQSDLWRIKAAYTQLRSGSDVPAFIPLRQGLDAVVAAEIPGVSAEAAELSNILTYKNVKIKYATLGLAFDDGVWLAQAEFADTSSSTKAIAHSAVGYISVGRRILDWTPYLLLSRSRPGNSVRVATNNWGPYNALLRDPAIFAVNQSRIEQSSLSIGTRYDFSHQMALKLQWGVTVIKPFGYPLWWSDPQRLDKTTRVRQVSATFDFAF